MFRFFIETFIEGIYSIAEAMTTFNLFPPPLPPIREKIKIPIFEDDAKNLKSDWDKVIRRKKPGR